MMNMGMIEKMFGLKVSPKATNAESLELEDVAIFVGLDSDPEHYAIVPDTPPEPKGISLEHVATLHEHRVGELARSVAEPVSEPLHKCPTCGELTLRMAIGREMPEELPTPPKSYAAQAPGPFQPGYTPPRCATCNLLGSHKPAADGKHYCKKHRPEATA
jgi:hypothetical protein